MEAIHLAAQGFSFRTRADAQLVRSGCKVGVSRIDGAVGEVGISAEARIGTEEPKRLTLNGSPLGSAEELRRRVHALVFTPDRLAVVKGGPATRRAYLDRTLARLLPARADVPSAYGAALGQRNACLRRIAAGLSPLDALDPWTAALAEAGDALAVARSVTLSLLAEPFAARAEELGLRDTRLELLGEPATVAGLEARLQRDLERGSTGAGPHLDEILILAGDRDLRVYGSQGEQRMTVLALVLAEAELLTAHDGIAPLLLLDDALSELDEARRRIISERVGCVGQAVVTATGAEALPLAPAQLLEVTPGVVRVA